MDNSDNDFKFYEFFLIAVILLISVSLSFDIKLSGISSIFGNKLSSLGTSSSTPNPSSPTVSITPTPAISITPIPTVTVNPEAVTRKVMVLDFNPLIPSQGNRSIRDVEGWADPVSLESQYINDIKTASGGYLNYQIVLAVRNINRFPTKDNGYVFTDSEYISALSNPTTNARAIIDYNKILADNDVCAKLNSGEIDELWLWGGPWFGYYEITMTGPSAFNTNSSPFTGNTCNKNMMVMGFSYERGIAEMLEDLGHGLEGTLTHIFGEKPMGTTIGNYSTPWGKFASSDITAPGKSGCGWMHYPPNTTTAKEYDYSNQRYVNSACDDWLNYPNLTGVSTSINCSNWNCDGYQFKKWWLTHLPKAPGKTNNFWNNWWKYFAAIN